MTPNDVKIVADNIDDFIEVPDGLSRLRKAVLTLAVSGKLVPQIPNEGTAKEFYEQIQIERLRAAKELVRQKKHNDKSEEITKEEEPFAIPSSWGWVRFQETFFSVRGITFPGGDKSKELEEGYIPVLRSGNVQDVLDLSNLLYVPEKHVRNKNQYLQEGDIVVSMANSRELVGKSCIAVNLKGKYSFGGFLSVFRPYLISPEYFQIVFSSDFARARFFKDAKQVTNIANLSLATINLIPFPLPPLAEQNRIVKKVEEVMKQLDELETKKRERDEMRTRLVRSAMQSLGKSESKIAFEQLTELIKTPSDLKELEGALLTLAVSGKLVPQDKKEGTAIELYEKIKTERLGKVVGRKNKTKTYAEVSSKELPFKIPESWQWFRIGDVGEVKGGKRLPKGSNLIREKTRHPYIRVTDMKGSTVKTEDIHYISDEVFSKISKYTISSDDIYITIAGTIGDAGKIPKELNGANLTENAAKLEFKGIDQGYLVLTLRSYPVQSQFFEKIVQMAQPKLALHRIESTIIPIPPLAEQKRIVKKVEEIMSLVNNLREYLPA